MDRKSYLLGIFDGEGSISGSARTESRGWTLNISVTMGPTDVVCELLRDEWGGNVRPVKVAESRQALWRWYVTGSKSLPFLRDAVEGLIVKRRQAEIAQLIATNMARYTSAARRGISVSRGTPFITAEDAAERSTLMSELKSLNGARARFAVVS